MSRIVDHRQGGYVDTVVIPPIDDIAERFTEPHEPAPVPDPAPVLSLWRDVVPTILGWRGDPRCGSVPAGRVGACGVICLTVGPSRYPRTIP